MLVSQRFGLAETSEKTLEFNVLNELASYLSSLGRTITVISPTQAEEDRLGFDDIIEGLPAGQVLAIQFKRPRELKRPRNAVRFLVDTSQLNRLAANFRSNEAYLFLSPFTKNDQVVGNRRRLLTVTQALDVFDIPNLYKTGQKTRTIRMHTSTLAIEVADPKRFEPVKKVTTVAKLARLISEGKVGYKIVRDEKEARRRERIGVRKLYYLHISQDHEGRSPILL